MQSFTSESLFQRKEYSMKSKPWIMPGRTLELSKLENKALRQFPGSPAQQETQQQIKALRKRLHLDESLETESGPTARPSGISMPRFIVESNSPQLEDHIEEFCAFVYEELGIMEAPSLTFVERTGQASFGNYTPSTSAIVVATEGRHMCDILRTVAHEIVHARQKEEGLIDSTPLLQLEFEANAIAGLLLRDANKAHPEWYGVTDPLPDDQLDQEGESQGAVASDTTRPSGPIEMAEDMTAGGGDVAGIGIGSQGEPGIAPKKKKTLKMFRRKLMEYHDKARAVNDTDAKKRLAQARTIFGKGQKK